MNLLITGAAGFIGSHVCEMALRRGHRVRAVARYNSTSSWGHLAAIPHELRDRLDVVLGDVRDRGQIGDCVDGCDTVLHLAALIGIPYSYRAPESYVSTNVLGTLNVLQACREAGVRRVVVTSTSEVYGTAITTPMVETHPLQAQSPYAASKIAADKLAESFANSFDLPVVILRPFNTYGPRQSARAIIPTILIQAMSDAEEIQLGNLAPKRDLTFVEDTARAFILAAEADGIDGATIHFGQSAAVSIGELAECCLRVAGSSARIVSVAERQRPPKSEVGLLLCDASKARRLLGWKPQVSLEDGLRRTVESIRECLTVYRSQEYTT